MAAIDPSDSPKSTATTNGDVPARATLKVVFAPTEPEEDSDDEDDEDFDPILLKALMGNKDSEDESSKESEDESADESSSDDEEVNGGPSDPSKTKKARRQAAAEEILKQMKQDDESGMDMDEDVGSSPSKADKGKGKATDESSDEGEELDSEDELEEHVICTLDAEKVSTSSDRNNGLADEGYRTINNHLILLFQKPSVSASKSLEPIPSTSLATT